MAEEILHLAGTIQHTEQRHTAFGVNIKIHIRVTDTHTPNEYLKFRCMHNMRRYNCLTKYGCSYVYFII